MADFGLSSKLKSGKELMNDFFKTNQMAADLQKDRVEEIQMSLIDDFSNHPFSVEYDDEMKKLEDSIVEHGLINPILVRPVSNGRYECIEGHRRRFVFNKHHRTTIPAIIKELDDVTATILMVDSNIYRETIKISDKAKAYQMKLEAMKAMKRSVPVTDTAKELLGRSDELIAKDSQESARTIQRIITLNNLIPDLLEMVDEKRIGLSPAYEIAALSEESQHELYDAILASDATPSVAQAKKLKMMEQEGTIEQNSFYQVMLEPKANQVEKISIRKERVKQYIPTALDSIEDIEKYIIEALKAFASDKGEK